MSASALHHVVVGHPARPAVVLLGSLGSTLDMWDRQVPALATSFRVVAADLRGHGGSPAPAGPYELDDLVDDVISLLDSLALDRAHLVGLSLGGMVAMRLAARNPDRVDRLAVLCTSALLGPAEFWHQRAAAVRAGGTASIAPEVVRRWVTPAFQDAPVVAALEAMVAGTSDHGYAACCEAIAAMDLRADLAAITAPTLAIAGAEDPATPPEHLALIASAIPGARLLVVPGAAHLANVEAADAVNAALLDHLTR
jgi:3-oxoadipate enol-lactonase